MCDPAENGVSFDAEPSTNEKAHISSASCHFRDTLTVRVLAILPSAYQTGSGYLVLVKMMPKAVLRAAKEMSRVLGMTRSNYVKLLLGRSVTKTYLSATLSVRVSLRIRAQHH
jgi:hypothetical protein